MRRSAKGLANRGAITTSAEEYGIEPRMLAALVYVTHREHSNPFRLTLEEMAMGARLRDANSHIPLEALRART